MLFKKRVIAAFASATFMIFCMSKTAKTQVFFIGDRGSLNATDSVDWSQYGTGAKFISDPSNFNSLGGITGTISDSMGGQLSINKSAYGWWGNLLPHGSIILWDWTGNSSLNITFDTPISSAGANIMPYNGGGYTASISAYDSHNGLLGIYSGSGYADSSSGLPAVFLGVSSDTPNISRIDFKMVNRGDSFAINTLDIKYDPSAPAKSVPEPGCLPFLLSGVFPGLAFLLKRRLSLA